jgi:high-affinity K+ transport system ATPase subunit B
MNAERLPRPRALFDAPLLRRAVADSFRKLDPSVQIRNP